MDKIISLFTVNTVYFIFTTDDLFHLIIREISDCSFHSGVELNSIVCLLTHPYTDLVSSHKKMNFLSQINNYLFELQSHSLTTQIKNGKQVRISEISLNKKICLNVEELLEAMNGSIGKITTFHYLGRCGSNSVIAILLNVCQTS